MAKSLSSVSQAPISLSYRVGISDELAPAVDPVARKLKPPIPVELLSGLSELPLEMMLPSAVDVIHQIYGGLGTVAYRVEVAEVEAVPAEKVRTDDGMELDEEELPKKSVSLEPQIVVPSRIVHEKFAEAAESLLLRTCEAVAMEASRSGESLSTEGELAGSKCQIMAIPFVKRGKVRAVLCRVQERKNRFTLPALAALQTVGVLNSLAKTKDDAQKVRARFAKAAAFVELPKVVASGIDFTECTRSLANHLRELFACDMVALSLRSTGGHKLVGISGETGPVESHSPGRRALLAHLSQAVHQRRPLFYQREEAEWGKNDAETTAIPLREWFDPSVSLCLPLLDGGEEPLGAWLLLWKKAPQEWEEKHALASAATPEIGALLKLLHQAKPGNAIGTMMRLWKRCSVTGRKALIILGATAAGLTLLPMPYPVRATSELQPAVRRVIAAPFDGTLLRSRVKAGELVAEGDLLAELEGRELRSQISEATADRERAIKGADIAYAGGKVAEGRVAELEAERLTHQIELLEFRQRNLEVRSPISGLVLQGDLERSEGAPLRVGDPLFEVGPLDQLVAEIAVDAVDVPYIRMGAKVELKFESFAARVSEGEVSRIAPKSEWRDDRNVFLCEVELPNPDESLRVGMKGKAKIAGPRRPLIWIWGRDAWLALRYWLW